MEKMDSSKLWWLNAPNTPKPSTWLQSTIKEMEEKTISMLKIIDEEADSFAQRAGNYYMNRPQLINMVEDLYRSHRSLAEKFYAAKLVSRAFCQQRRLGAWPIDCFSSKQDKSSSATSFADTYEDEILNDSDRFSNASEVDDPEIEMGSLVEVSSESREMMKLREEIKSLGRENEMKQIELTRKDEEKMEVIRQLSFAVDLVKEENLMLKKSLAAKSFNALSGKWNIPDLRKVFFIGI